ncbi:hypothetical protein [Psychroflexus aestuariivivens]|uniref:hypothetical protein n=1 Tax=Psychroflexus aestuariivivens TaxID=1795040 RepID=UPI000FDB6801|nr:hypothetical protein [Psychroflexus aestuariivivens]
MRLNKTLFQKLHIAHCEVAVEVDFLSYTLDKLVNGKKSFLEKSSNVFDMKSSRLGEQEIEDLQELDNNSDENN